MRNPSVEQVQKANHFKISKSRAQRKKQNKAHNLATGGDGISGNYFKQSSYTQHIAYVRPFYSVSLTPPSCIFHNTSSFHTTHTSQNFLHKPSCHVACSLLMPPSVLPPYKYHQVYHFMWRPAPLLLDSYPIWVCTLTSNNRKRTSDQIRGVE